MKPRARFYRWLKERLIVSDVRAEYIAGRKPSIIFRVDLINAPKATKLSFDSVKVSVVIAVACSECRVTPLVVDSNTFDAVNRKWQPGNPGPALQFVEQVELR